MCIYMKKYKGYHLYFFEKNIEKILEKIIDKQYKIEEEYKNDRRTYVAKIKIGNESYILKKTFQKNILKKLVSSFKISNSVETFKNVNKAKESIEELVNIYGAGVNKKIFIKDEFFLMEYKLGYIYKDDNYYIKIMKILEKIHSKGYYHGDANPFNFLFNDEKKIYVLDTKLKKMKLGNYRAHYDMLTLYKYFKEIKPKYPYKRNLSYWIAFLMRKYRDGKQKYRNKR